MKQTHYPGLEWSAMGMRVRLVVDAVSGPFVMGRHPGHLPCPSATYQIFVLGAAAGWSAVADDCRQAPWAWRFTVVCKNFLDKHEKREGLQVGLETISSIAQKVSVILLQFSGYPMILGYLYNTICFLAVPSS